MSRISGGCINRGVRLEAHDGTCYFLKWKAEAPRGMFTAEAEGLRALCEAAALIDPADRPRVPRPLSTADDPDGTPWLLMEWIPVAAPAPDSDERLGRGLAHVHGSSSDRRVGWHTDNWIGSLPQANGERTSWADFWREQRIVPQLERARERGYLTEPSLDQLVDRIPRALEGVNRFELLHGDLWSGNTFFTEGGTPVLIDPSVYRGDGEVDLAMSELFGGFGSRFYAAYSEVRPVSSAYGSHRRSLYQLYYLLVHVNLFGGAYVPRTLSAAEIVLAALR